MHCSFSGDSVVNGVVCTGVLLELLATVVGGNVVLEEVVTRVDKEVVMELFVEVLLETGMFVL